MNSHPRKLWGLGGAILSIGIASQGACSQHVVVPATGIESPRTMTSPSGNLQTPETNGTVAKLTSSLLSEEESVRVDAERQLIVLAKASSENRKVVIEELLTSAGKQNKLDGKS